MTEHVHLVSFQDRVTGTCLLIQAKDVDGPMIIPGTCLSASADFTEFPNLDDSYNDPVAGHCGTYRFQASLYEKDIKSCMAMQLTTRLLQYY